MQRQHRFSGKTIQKTKMSWSNLYFNLRVEEKEITTFRQRNFILNKQRHRDLIIKLIRFVRENSRIFCARQNIVIWNETYLVCKTEKTWSFFLDMAGKTAVKLPNYLSLETFYWKSWISTNRICFDLFCHDSLTPTYNITSHIWRYALLVPSFQLGFLLDQ